MNTSEYTVRLFDPSLHFQKMRDILEPTEAVQMEKH